MFKLIADTGGPFLDFAPYVASLNDHGVVAFQATLREGGSGVFCGDGRAVSRRAIGPHLNIYSHPDINNDGLMSVYAEGPAGVQGVFLLQTGEPLILADTDGDCQRIGPLGPTMNEQGAVAFRADLKSGASGIFAGGALVADSRGPLSGFHGLPVINQHGTVVFRADHKGGGQGIYAGTRAVLESGELFREFGRFPSQNDSGTVAFCASLTRGGEGIFTVTDGKITTVVDGSAFASFRGALINNAGTVVFLATPPGGELGIYTLAGRVLAGGQEMFGSLVTDLAVNHVSLNHTDQLAIRVGLADQRQLIVRADLARQ